MIADHEADYGGRPRSARCREAYAPNQRSLTNKDLLEQTSASRSTWLLKRTRLRLGREARLLDEEITVGSAGPEMGRSRPASRGLVQSRHRDRDFALRRILLGGDLSALGLALALAFALSGRGLGASLLWFLPTLPFWGLLFWAYRLYMRPIRRFEPSHLDDVPSLFHALLLGTLALWLYYKFVAPVERLNFEEVAVFGIVALPLIASLRAALRAANLRRQGPERVFAVARPEDIEMLHRKFRNHPEYEMELVGAVDENTSDELGLRLHTDLEELHTLLAAGEVDHLMVRLDAAYIPQEQIQELMRLCHREGVRFGFFPGVKTLLPPGIEVNHLEGVGFLSAHPPVLARSGHMLKRGLDMALSSILLVAFSPVFALIAVAIKLDSKGPVCFRQTRIGKDAVPFQLVKFRTMIQNAEALEDELMAQSLDPHWLVVRDDPRITRVGRLLRRTSLDEVPQLWNVLKGEMSVVGPRPLSERDDAKVEGWKRHRLDVVPGMTGYWQVLGRNNIPFEEMLEVDYCYVTSWSLWHDMKLLLKTVPVVLSRRGAN